MNTLRTVVVLMLGALAAWSAQAAPQGKDRFSETIDVVTVEVPVYVVRQGAAVRDLTAENFELFADNKKVVLEGFEVVDLENVTPSTTRPAVMSEAPLVGRRHFLLLFDLSFTEPGATIKARDAAIDLVMNDVHPTDLVGVAAYTLNGGVKMVLGFSPDRRQVVTAIRRMGDPQLFEQTGDPLRLLVDPSLGEGVESGLRSTGSNSGGAAGNVNIEGLQQQNLRDLARESGKAQRNVDLGRISSFLGSFEELAKILDTVEGKKHVVLLSEGWDSSLLVGSFDAKEQMRQAEAASWGNLSEVNSADRMGQSAELNHLDRVLESFKRSDAVIQAVDVGGLRQDAIGGGKAQSDNSLFMLADGTGGELYRNFNDLGNAMGQLLDRTSVTYLLSFQPSQLERDGSFHKLRVKLKNVPKARVVHRPGFFAPKPYAEMAAVERQLDAADFIMSGEDSGSLAAEALATPMPGRDGKAYVPVLIEVDGNSLLAEQPDDKLVGLEFFAYAFDAAGGAQDYFSQNMGLEVAKVRQILEQSGLKFFGHLDLKPGDYLVRVLVRDARTGRYAARALPITVPDFDQTQAFLSPPLFPEPLGKWLMVRENEQRRDASLPYPFMAGDQPYVPAAMPKMEAADIQLNLMAFGVAGSSVSVDGWLLGGDGQRLQGSEVALVEHAVSPGGGPDQIVASLKVPELAPGSYTVVVNVKDDRGNEVTSSGPLRAGDSR